MEAAATLIEAFELTSAILSRSSSESPSLSGLSGASQLSGLSPLSPLSPLSLANRSQHANAHRVPFVIADRFHSSKSRCKSKPKNNPYKLARLFATSIDESDSLELPTSCKQTTRIGPILSENAKADHCLGRPPSRLLAFLGATRDAMINGDSQCSSCQSSDSRATSLSSRLEIEFCFA